MCTGENRIYILRISPFGADGAIINMQRSDAFTESKTRCPQRTQHEIMSLWRRFRHRETPFARLGESILGTGTCIGDVVIPRSIQMDRRLRLADQRASHSFRVPKVCR